MAEAQKIIRPHAGFQEKFVRSNVDVCFGGGQLAGGKAQPLDSLVCTPFGFRKMGDLKVGDIISNSNGGMQKVIQVFDRGELPTVGFEFADGRTVKCTYDHLWKARRVMTRPKRFYLHNEDREEFWEIMTTDTIIKILDSAKRNKVFVPMCSPIQFTRGNRTQGLTIHPYVLGCLLGDGCLSKTLYKPKFFSADTEIVEKIKSLGYDIRKNGCDDITYTIYDESLKKALVQKRLWGKLSNKKYIPDVYKYSTIEDRKELLRGLFDTDGYAKKRTVINFDVVSERLANDVAWIVRSLGGYASIYTKEGSYRNENGEKVICQQVYRVYINIKDASDLFTLHRKKDALTDEYRNGTSCEDLGIVGYKILPSVPMRCIRVSNPNSLYVTDNFVVTHNTFGATMMTAEPSLDPRFNGLFLRNNLDDLKAGGGILDAFRECYGNSIRIVESGAPRVDFPSGARIDLTHVAEQDIKSLERRFKGRQYDLIYYDELTGFEWTTFTYLFSRNRGQAKWTGKVRATTNPKRSHWVRKFIDWYVGIDGEIMEEREGVVRYFYIAGENVESVVWGDSKEEVYQKCKIQIDRFLSKFNGKTGKATYKDVIKSFTFYLGRTSENKSLGEGYASSVAAMGGRKAEENSGNWNIDSDSDESAPIPQHVANQVFITDPQTNGDKWVTCDLADTGTDNFLALAWDGFHIFDALILGRTTPRMNAERLELFAKTHGISNSHIIYDAVRGTYINDYIPEAIPFVSYRAPMGMYGRMAYNLKAECYLRLIEVLKRENLSMADEVSQRVYEHQNLKSAITIQNEFMEECSVVRFKDMQSGKKALISKKEMNAKLGKARSMDLLDPIAMRMLPCLEYVYGEELEKTTPQTVADDDDDYYYRRKGVVNIYDDTTWA